MSTHRDERIVATRQRWATHGFALWFIALTIDLIVRSLILKHDPRQYLDIWLIWMATVLYVSIGMAASGVAPFGGKWSTSWLVILILAVELPLLGTLTGMIHTPVAFIAGVFLTGGSAFLSVIALRGIYRAWERRTLGRAPREE